MRAMHGFVRQIALLLGAVLAADVVAEGDEVRYIGHEVVSADGVALSVQEWGNPHGPAVVFVHGYAQAHLSWRKQVEDPDLADRFRMVTFDLRGHGMSDKPRQSEYYREGERWAADVNAIIDSLDLADPVLVAWSMGGRVVGDYVAHHGDGALGGIVAVGALMLDDPGDYFGPALRHMPDMVSADLGTAIDGTSRFIDEMFAVRQPAEAVQVMLGYSMMTPRYVRLAVGGREIHHESHWRDLDVPLLLSHGREDRVVLPAMSERAAALVPDAATSFMDGIGHAPFLEAPERFNEELATFVRDIHAG